MTHPVLPLNDGSQIPQLGFGTWQTPEETAAAAVSTALAAGYRLIDTASIYGNEAGVGEGILASGVPRKEIFVTTKLWNSHQGYDEALRAYDESLRRLRLEYVDLYLIHWPMPIRGRYLDSWRALVALKKEGRVRSIGVSNFQVPHLQHLFDETGVLPSVNQIELHPYFQQRPLRMFHAQHGIITESWSPLGQGGALLRDRKILRIAKMHQKTAAQVVLRWHLDSGLVAIPKSVKPKRIRENLNVFDFQLSSVDFALLDGLDNPKGRIGPDPDTA
ncbi:MAG: aldo/keto reductase, partial [Betaproteobacteria bacterium]|nr:aldo/keto reductase [Betaproteobacteria bacterium]